MTEPKLTLLEVGQSGSRLQVSAEKLPSPAVRDPWFSVEILADAYPFQGVVTTTFTLDDLHRWGAALRALATTPGTAILGGGRAAELVVDCETQTGGAVGAQALEVRLTPSGDDPFPHLSFLVFDVENRVWADASEAVLSLR